MDDVIDDRGILAEARGGVGEVDQSEEGLGASGLEVVKLQGRQDDVALLLYHEGQESLALKAAQAVCGLLLLGMRFTGRRHKALELLRADANRSGEDIWGGHDAS